MRLLLFLVCSLLSAQQINLRQIQSNVSPPPQFAIPFVSNAPGTIIGYDATHLNWDTTNLRVNLQGAKFLNLTGGGTVCVTASNTGIIAGALCNSLLSPPITLTDISTPANPASGKTNVYTKAGQVCGLSPAGVETCGPSGLSTASFFAAAQTPGGTLTAATPATITLAPCPAGVDGADAGHYLYVSSGTGTAESVLVTAGTCTSGAATGTVVFTPANNHSGAWTIQSATAGIQECLQFVGALGSCVIPVGINQVYGPINFTANNQSLLGYGRTVSLIRANFNSGNIIVDGSCGASTCTGFNYVLMSEFGVFRQNGYTALPTSGSNISVLGGAYVQLQNLYIRHSYNAIDTIGNCTAGAALGNCSLVYMRDVTIEAVANIGIIGFEGTSDGLIYTPGQGGSYSVTYTPLYEIEFLFADGTKFTNTLLGGPAQSGGGQIIFAPPSCTSCRVGLVNFSRLQDDSWTVAPAVIFDGTGNPTFASNNVVFENSSFTNSAGNTSPVFKVNTATLNVNINGCVFANLTGKIFDTDSAYITFGTFSNNTISGTADTIPAITLAGGSNWTINGNQFNAGGGATPTYDLEITGVITSLTIVGNSFYSGARSLHITAIPTQAVIEDNVLVDSPLTVASASSVTLPIGYDNFVISGTTGINTIVNLYEGRKVTMLTTDGPVLFTAGASIGNTFTSAQNSPVLGTSYSGQLFLSNSSGGATIFSQLGNGSIVRTSSTVLTIDSGCAAATPCPVRVGDTVYVFTSSATATISAGSATAYVYIDGSGTRTVAAGADTVVCSGCTNTAGTSFPAGVVQYGTWTAASGTWTASGGYTDLAAPLGVKPNTAAGYGLTQSGNTIALDSTLGFQSAFNRAQPYIFDEFFPGNSNTVVGQLGWSPDAVVGSGANAFAAYVGHPGVIYVATSGSSGDTQALALNFANSGPLNAWLSLGTSSGFTGWKTQFTIITDDNAGAVTSTAYAFGFSDTHTYRSGNQINIRYDATSVSCGTGSNSTTDWMFEVLIAGVSNCVDTTISVVAASWYTFDIESSLLGTVTASVSQNGGVFSTPVTLSSGVPTASMSPRFLVKTETATARRFSLDWWAMQFQGVTR